MCPPGRGVHQESSRVGSVEMCPPGTGTGVHRGMSKG
jgi:hypothetical protein